MAQKSSSSSRATWHNYPHWSSVERFVEQVRRLDPLLVLIFGSAVTGEFTQYSDADLLIVFEQPVDWETVYACSDGVVQPTVKTWDELTEQIAAGEPFLCEIVEDGQALFDVAGVHEQLRRYAATARERLGLERTPAGWRWDAG